MFGDDFMLNIEGSLDLFKDSLRYPIENPKVWLSFIILFFITTIFSLTVFSTIDNTPLFVIFGILFIVMSVITLGFSMKIIRNQIYGSDVIVDDMDEIPSNIKDDFIEGIEAVVVEVIYLVIPAMFLFILTYITGLFDWIVNFTIQLLMSSGIDGVVFSQLSSFIHTLISIVFCGVAVESVMFLISTIAIAKHAADESMMSALNIRGILSKISSIGWDEYVVYLILLILTISVLNIILTIVCMIPYVGKVISFTMVGLYILIVTNVSLGKIYTQ